MLQDIGLQEKYGLQIPPGGGEVNHIQPVAYILHRFQMLYIPCDCKSKLELSIHSKQFNS